MIIVDVFVPGAAKTKGSMEVRNRATGAMKESVVGSSRWRALMAQAVRDDIARRCAAINAMTGFEDFKGEPYPGAVAVRLAFWLTPPRKPPASWLQRLWPIWERAGDLDKLTRNVLDALGSKSKNAAMNGGAIVDDNLVCHLDAWKHVVVPGTELQDGVRIIVETL